MASWSQEMVPNRNRNQTVPYCQVWLYFAFVILSLLYQGQDVWYLDWKADNIVKNLSCLTYDSRCFSIDQTTIKNGTESEYFDTKNPCIFPFKYFDTTYNSCTRNGGSGFWCATSVDVNLNWKTYGYCNDLCPLEGVYLYILKFSKF